MTDAASPEPPAAPAPPWTSAAGRALGWVAGGLLVGPFGSRLCAALGAVGLPRLVEDAAARVVWGERLVAALVVPGVVGPAIVLVGTVRLARAMRAGPRGDSPVYAFGPVLLAFALLGRVGIAPLTLVSEGAGPLRVGSEILAAFPPVVGLLLAAATAARAGAAFVVWAAWAAAVGSLATDLLALGGLAGDGPRLVAAGVVAAVAVVAATVTGQAADDR